METNEKKTPLKKDPRDEVCRGWQGAVLLCDEIKYYCTQVDPPLIHPFEEEDLQPASYRLHLGEKCRVDGEDQELSIDKPRLTIPPHGLAVVTTLEKLNIPGFLIARWNLKVKKVYQGLLWVGGPQVDPGYTGNLFCPLYNLSTKEVHLELREALFTIDFVRTTSYDESKGCKLWEPKEGRPTNSFGPLDTLPLRSGVKQDVEDMKNCLKDSEKKVEYFQSRIDTFQVITFTVLGIIVASLAFMGVSQFGGLSTKPPSCWQIATWLIVLVSILILTGVLAYAGVQTMCRNKKNGDPNGKNNKL